MRALEEVVASGRVRFVGVSNFTGAMMAECMRTRRIDVSQVGYHMLDRRQERETFPHCLDHGIGVMGYGSLGHGLLTGAFTASTTFDPARDWRGNGVAFGQPIFRGDNFTTQRRRGRAAAPRGGRAARCAPEPDRAGVGARPPRDQHRAGGRPHARRGGRQRRRARSSSSPPAERATIDAILAGAAGQRAGVHPAAPGHGAVGRGDPGSGTAWSRMSLFTSRCGSSRSTTRQTLGSPTTAT